MRAKALHPLQREWPHRPTLCTPCTVGGLRGHSVDGTSSANASPDMVGGLLAAAILKAGDTEFGELQFHVKRDVIQRASS